MDDQSQAYEEIIGPLEDRMIRSIWRITRDPHDAEDAMQNCAGHVVEAMESSSTPSQSERWC